MWLKTWNKKEEIKYFKICMQLQKYLYNEWENYQNQMFLTKYKR